MDQNFIFNSILSDLIWITYSASSIINCSLFSIQITSLNPLQSLSAFELRPKFLHISTRTEYEYLFTSHFKSLLKYIRLFRKSHPIRISFVFYMIENFVNVNDNATIATLFWDIYAILLSNRPLASCWCSVHDRLADFLVKLIYGDHWGIDCEAAYSHVGCLKGTGYEWMVWCLYVDVSYQKEAVRMLDVNDTRQIKWSVKF